MHLMTPDLGYHDKILQSNLIMEALMLKKKKDNEKTQKRFTLAATHNNNQVN